MRVLAIWVFSQPLSDDLKECTYLASNLENSLMRVWSPGNLPYCVRQVAGIIKRTPLDSRKIAMHIFLYADRYS